MASQLSQIWNFILNGLSQIGSLYLAGGILTAVIAIAVIRRVVNIIKRLMP